MNPDPFFLKEPTNFDDYIGKSTSSFPKDLTDFCLGDPDLPLGQILKKGSQSLRTGFYKIIEEPSERDYYNGINTYAAHVLFFRKDYTQPIKYYANVGPLMNFNAKYEKEENGAWTILIRNRRLYADKDDFFKGITNKEFEVIKDEWIFSDKFKTNVKKITWKFNQ